MKERPMLRNQFSASKIGGIGIADLDMWPDHYGIRARGKLGRPLGKLDFRRNVDVSRRDLDLL